MFKEQKGVTLIALVITIIVLLILAGVSIAMLTGDNKSADSIADMEGLKQSKVSEMNEIRAKMKEDSKNNTFIENRTNGNYNELITNRQCQMTRKKGENYDYLCR